jgi:hypothetical protein
MKNNKVLLSSLSPHLFWDVDINLIDIERSKNLIVKRVLDYGLINDWHILVKIYGIPAIAIIAMNIKDLDKKSASFIALLSKTSTKDYLCFTSKQSMPQHMIF